jgi:Lrp/AsnC family leucine-responsive transcriptional regulator
MPEYTLDQTDREILNLLQKDGRLSHKQLAAMVNLSITPIHIRVRRLEELNYIKRFTAILNPKKIGKGLIGYVEVKLIEHTEESLTNFMAEAVKLEEVMECYHMSGAYDFLMRIVINDMDEYSKVLMKKLSKLPGKAHFESFFVMTEGKCETAFKVR